MHLPSISACRTKLIDRIRAMRAKGKYAFASRLYWRGRAWYFTAKSLALFAVCSIAAALRLPWPRAYWVVGDKRLSMLYALIESDSYRPDVADALYRQIVVFSDRASQFKADNVEAAQMLAQAALVSGRMDAWLAAQRNVIRFQESRALRAGGALPAVRTIDCRQIFNTLGHTFTLDAWIKSGILELRPPSRTIVLTEPPWKMRPINQCMIDYWKPYIEFVDDPVEQARWRPLEQDLRARHDSYIPTGDRVVPYAHSASVWVQTEWERQGRAPLLRLSDEHRTRGREALARMGVPDDAWFVVTHVRSSGFKGTEGYRDSDIATYFDAYREVTSRGGWVVRMGDASMNPLPPMARVVDYAVRPDRSDWMDVYLLAAARFMIGTSSGPTAVSYVFGVPVVMTNNLPSAATYFTKQDIFLPRLMRRQDGTCLNLEESMTLPFSMGVIDGTYTNIFKVATVPNTPSEIADAVVEMLEKLDGKIRYDEADEMLQRRFKALTAAREVMIGLPGFELQCRLGRGFLRNHQRLLG